MKNSLSYNAEEIWLHSDQYHNCGAVHWEDYIVLSRSSYKAWMQFNFRKRYLWSLLSISMCEFMKDKNKNEVQLYTAITPEVKLRFKPTTKSIFPITQALLHWCRLHTVLTTEVLHCINISMFGISTYVNTVVSGFLWPHFKRVLIWIRNGSRQLDLLAPSLSLLVRPSLSHYSLTEMFSHDKQLCCYWDN